MRPPKVCPDCGRLRAAVLFPRHRVVCELCWVKQNEASRIVTQVHTRARRRGLPYGLSVEWVKSRLADGFCEVTGLKFETGAGLNDPMCPTVDRIVPALGYVDSNCRMVVWIFNRARGPWADADVLKMAEAVVERVSQQTMPQLDRETLSVLQQVIDDKGHGARETVPHGQEGLLARAMPASPPTPHPRHPTHPSCDQVGMPAKPERLE